MPIDHAVVWMDFRMAKVFVFDDAALSTNVIEFTVVHDESLIPGRGIRKGQGRGNDNFFDDVLRSLGTASKWLILGNRSNCLGFLKRMCRQKFDGRIVGVEFIDAFTDEEILSRARSYFSECRRVIS